MANTYLTRTPSSAGNRRTWTISTWVKFSGDGDDVAIFNAWYADSNVGHFTFKRRSTNSQLGWSQWSSDNYTNASYRDVNGWYHIVLAVDTTQSTASNRQKLYVNGEQVTSFSTSYTLGLNEELPVNNNNIHTIGANKYSSIGNYFNGSMSHFHMTDGTAYDATAFGETDATTGEWKIKTSPSVTYGTNGFFILKDGNSVTDQSGNSNNWTVAGGTLTKTEDSPSNVFATWNPLQATTAATYDFSAGNTRMAVNDTAVFSLGATLAATTGKYYMEMKWVQQGGNGSWGMIPIDTDINNRPRNAGVGWNQQDNAPWLLGTIVSGSWGGSIGTNDIIQLAMDLDNGAFYFGKNGTYLNSGNPTSGSSKTGAVNFSGTSLFGKQLTFAIGKGASGTDGWNANFGNGYIEQTAVASAGTNASGNGIFEYDVPTGFTALSTKGLNL